MKYILNLSAVVFLSVFLSGCIVIGNGGDWDDDDWRRLQNENRETISELAIGSKRQQVLDRLGAPSFSEAFTKADDEYRVLFYRTQRRKGDGETSKDETTPLVFKNDELVGWGFELLDKVR